VVAADGFLFGSFPVRFTMGVKIGRNSESLTTGVAYLAKKKVL